jgi:hypothetical protein
MKTYKQFISEMQLKLPQLKKPTSGQIIRGGSSLINPFSGIGGRVVSTLGNAIGSSVGGQTGQFIKKVAPVAGFGFSLTRAATPVGVTAAVFNQGTARGRVAVNRDKSGKPIYMDK